MTIGDRIEKLLKDKTYSFIGIQFDIYDSDLIRIYDKVEGVCLFNCTVREAYKIPKELMDKDFKKSEIIKLPRKLFSKEHSTFAVCFYLDAPSVIEKPLSARMEYK